MANHDLYSFLPAKYVDFRFVYRNVKTSSINPPKADFIHKMRKSQMIDETKEELAIMIRFYNARFRL